MDKIGAVAIRFPYFKLKVLAASNLLPSWWHLREQAILWLKSKGLPVDDSESKNRMRGYVETVARMMQIENAVQGQGIQGGMARTPDQGLGQGFQPGSPAQGSVREHFRVVRQPDVSSPANVHYQA